MAPGKTSIIARLGQVAVDLHNNQFPYRVSDCVREEYKIKAPFMAENGDKFADLDNNLEELIPVLDENPRLASKFHTTMALTMMSGSPQANILPTEAKLVLNCRLLEGDTVESLHERFKAIAGEDVTVTVLKGKDPSPVSRTDSEAYLCIKELTEELYPGALVVPGVLGGGTDARNYYPICDSVYRYGGFPAGAGGNAHNFNEKFPVEACGKGPEFFARLIMKYGSFKA